MLNNICNQVKRKTKVRIVRAIMNTILFDCLIGYYCLCMKDFPGSKRSMLAFYVITKFKILIPLVDNL